MPVFYTIAPNVLYTEDWGAGYKFDLDGQKPSGYLYFQRVFARLQTIMGSAFWSWRFYSLNALPEQRIDEVEGLPGDECKRALFYWSDESSSVPVRLLRQFDVVFKNYIADSRLLPKRIIPLHLGTVNTRSDIDHRPIPFSERSTSVFFSGCLNDNRVPLARGLKGGPAVDGWRFLQRHGRVGPLRRALLAHVCAKAARQIPSSQITFTPGFLSGMPSTEYWGALAKSRIALCPKGFRSTETFRHYEATKMGCVVVTDSLPSTHLYRSEHFVVIDDWSKIVQVCLDLLRNAQELARLSRAATEHWNRTMSEGACARSVAEALSTLGRGRPA